MAEWKDALIFNKTARDPNGNSWERNGNKLHINWTTKKEPQMKFQNLLYAIAKKADARQINANVFPST